jgi:hypothetical protein
MRPSLRSVIEKFVNALKGRASSKRRALEAGHLVERVGDQLVAQAAAAAERHVALALELRRRLVEAVPVRLDVVAAAAGVADFERHAPRQLALDAGREVVDVRHDEVGVREAGAAAEERGRAEGAARRRLDALRERVAQRVGRRAAAVVRGDERRRQAEAVRVPLARRVQEVLAVAAADDGLVVERVGHADARLVVVLVELPRRLRRPVDADEGHAADDRLADAGRDRVGQGRIEGVVQPVLFLTHRAVAVPAEAQVDRELVADAPVVLDPGRDEEPLVVREHVDRHFAVGRSAQQE